MIVKVPIQSFSHYIYSRFQKVKSQEIFLLSLGGISLSVYLDSCFGFETLPRSIDRIKVYWLIKDIHLDKLTADQQEKAIDEALSNCTYPEHLMPYIRVSQSLEKSDKEELEELTKNIQEALEKRGWYQPKKSFFEKTLSEKKENIEPKEEKFNVRSLLATLLNYWHLITVKTPTLVKFAANHSKAFVKTPFLYPIETSLGFYAVENSLLLTHEILSKMKYIDENTPWVKKLEKISKFLSIDSEVFFLKKDRKTIYAILQLLLPFLIIYLFQKTKESPLLLGKQRLYAIEKHPFSLPYKEHSLLCLTDEDKVHLENFCCVKKRLAHLTSPFNEMTMSILKDFEYAKNIESLTGLSQSLRFLYIDHKKILSENLKEAFLKDLKNELSDASKIHKQQVFIVIDSLSWEHLKGETFKKFLKGVEEHEPRILFLDIENIDKNKELTDSYKDEAESIALTPSIGKLLKRYYENHPLSTLISEYSDEDYLQTSFRTIIESKHSEEKSLEKYLEKLQASLEKCTKEKREKINRTSQKKVKIIRNQVDKLKKIDQKISVSALGVFKKSLNNEIVGRQKDIQVFLRKQRILLQLLKRITAPSL